MKFFAEINETYCEVNFYYFADDCDTSECYCGKWMGYFSFELAGTDVTIYSWNLEQYDTRALRKAINFFITSYCKPNNIGTIFVERSLGDRVWELLGWEIVDKCLMLERAATLCT